MEIRGRRVFCRNIVLVALIVLFAGCGEPVPRGQPLAPDAVILAFGDSLTRGTGANEDHGYPAVLEKLSGRRVINAGIPGETTDRGLARLPSVLDAHDPDLLILCHGGNDFLRRLPGADTAANLRGMISEARSRGVPVILIGVPKPRLFLDEGDEIYRLLAEDYRLPLDNEVMPALLSDPALKSDPVHLNATGYRRMAEAILAMLREYGYLDE